MEDVADAQTIAYEKAAAEEDITEAINNTMDKFFLKTGARIRDIELYIDEIILPNGEVGWTVEFVDCEVK